MKHLTKQNIAIGRLSKQDVQIIRNFGLATDKTMVKVSSADARLPMSKSHGIVFSLPHGGAEFVDTDTWTEHLVQSRMEEISVAEVDEKHGNRACCVFLGILDYLAFHGITHNYPSALPLPSIDTVFILEGANNFFQVVAKTDIFDKVCLFMPKSDFGQTMTRTMVARNPRHIVNYDGFYTEGKSLFEFYQNLRRA